MGGQSGIMKEGKVELVGGKSRIVMRKRLAGIKLNNNTVDGKAGA